MKKQSNLNKLMNYAGKHRYFTYFSWVLAAASGFIALAPFWYIWKIVKEVLEVAPAFNETLNLVHNGWMAVLYSVLSLLIYIGALMCSHFSAFRIARNLRIKMMHHIVKLPLGYVESFGSGKLRKIVNESSGATETYLAHQLPNRYVAIATPIGLLFMLFTFDWRLGLFSLAPVFIAFAIMFTMTGEKMRKKVTEYQNALNDMSNEAVEYVRGMPVVKAFGQTVFSFKRFKDTIDNYKQWVTSYTKSIRFPAVLCTTVINSIFAFLITAALIFTRNGITNEFLLNMIFYVIITPIITLSLTKILFQSQDAMIVDDAMERIERVFSSIPLSEQNTNKQIKDGAVHLKNVTYSYDGIINALDDVSIVIPDAQTVALVGPSGGGKTTIGSIISRFFDPQQGKILIGGVDVKEIPKDKLMEIISFVFQNSRLIKTSIFENVRLGKPDASRKEVLNALEAAQCADIINKFPEGIDTVIGKTGVYLSGGEQQRISIARAILKNSPIIILDEATAFADPDNEDRVQAALTALAENKTVIMIAHRLSTIVGADNIFVLKDGKIAEQGTHDQLMKAKGIYEDMWHSYELSVQWKVAREA